MLLSKKAAYKTPSPSISANLPCTFAYLLTTVITLRLLINAQNTAVTKSEPVKRSASSNMNAANESNYFPIRRIGQACVSCRFARGSFHTFSVATLLMSGLIRFVQAQEISMHRWTTYLRTLSSVEDWYNMAQLNRYRF